MLELRDVVGFEGLYKVSPKGDIWSVRSERFLKPAGGKGNYQMVLLQVNGKKTYDYVHRIVAKAYIPNPNNWPEVNHKDEVKENGYFVKYVLMAFIEDYANKDLIMEFRTSNE